MKNRYVLLTDLPLIALAVIGAFVGRFDLEFYLTRSEFPKYLIAALLIKPTVFYFFALYRRYWRYASVPELVAVALAVTASSLGMAVFVLVGMLAGFVPGFSRTVIFNDWLLTLVLVGGFRLAIRVVHESSVPRPAGVAQGKRHTLIVGAGAAGTMVAREMRRNPQLGMEAAGFLDDDAGKLGKHIAGLSVLGTTQELPDIVRSFHIDNVIIAMPTARGSVVRSIHYMCNEAGVKSQTMPGVFELLDGNVNVNRLRNVDIVDLLRRSPVKGGADAAEFVTGRVVLVTGAGGSIGSELARQIANASPAHLILLGHGENSLFDAEGRLRAAFPRAKFSSVVADIRDEERIAAVFDRFKPAIVFHAAAHKHVPLMEANPEEAVTNNIVGTRNVVRHALRTATERFVLISTDKAAAPTSIMGATKRIAEAIVRQAAQQSGRAFVVVRFGNVLGSRGSVVHTFKAQIEAGGPVTVTHPDMTRFFMTIPEAVYLVLQASGMCKGGELFVLDMGEPVKIVELARDLIKLSGVSEDDIPITFTGMRPGEKLEEIVFDAGMRTRSTPHPEVLEVIGNDTCVGSHLEPLVSELAEAARHGDRTMIMALLGQTIPDYRAAEEAISGQR